MVEINICIIIFIVVIAIFAEVFSYKCNKKRYNNGYCPDCGQKLYQFDVDSQGGRGYACDNCCYTTWIDCKLVDLHHRN